MSKIKVVVGGVYRTNDGNKAVILHRMRCKGRTKRDLKFNAYFLGYVVDQGEHRANTWYDDGEASEYNPGDSLAKQVK